MTTFTTDKVLSADEVAEMTAQSIRSGDNMLAQLINQIWTYEEASVMTNDAGFVIKLDGGSEFQVTIVRSK